LDVSAERATADGLRRVRRRRRLPQRLQALVQERIVARVFRPARPLRQPRVRRLVARMPPLQRLLGRLVGSGARPEHVRSG
jgi:hypothetical protein